MLDDVDIWAYVPKYPRYEVNKFGAVRNVDSGVLLRPFTRNGRTLYVKLYGSPGRASEKTVASVVWAAFHKRWPNGSYVCHLDGDVTNNSIENLYLGSQSDVNRTRRRLDDTIWDILHKEGDIGL